MDIRILLRGELWFREFQYFPLLVVIVVIGPTFGHFAIKFYQIFVGCQSFHQCIQRFWCSHSINSYLASLIHQSRWIGYQIIGAVMLSPRCHYQNFQLQHFHPLDWHLINWASPSILDLRSYFQAFAAHSISLYSYLFVLSSSLPTSWALAGFPDPQVLSLPKVRLVHLIALLCRLWPLLKVEPLLRLHRIYGRRHYPSQHYYLFHIIYQYLWL